MGPRAGLDGRKISSPPEFDPGPSSPIAQSLYRLSYRAHYIYIYIYIYNKLYNLLCLEALYNVLSEVLFCVTCREFEARAIRVIQGNSLRTDCRKKYEEP